MNKSRYIARGLIHCIAWMLLFVHPAETADNPSEYEVKAAFIYHFAKFIHWPETSGSILSDSVFVIGLVGDNPFGSFFEELIGQKQIQGMPIRIKRFPRAEDVQPVHILFVSESEKHRMSGILNRLDGFPVLTVGEFEGFLESGGMIYLFLEGNRVRFAVNREAASEKALDISAKLLNLAKNL